MDSLQIITNSLKILTVKNKILNPLLFLFFINVTAFTSFTQTDSLKEFRYDEYIRLVLENHPRVFQGEIKIKEGEATIQKAKGEFDPELFGDVDQKYFDNKQYYSTINSGLRIPTWFGITANAGYQQNDGLFLNPQSRLPDVGLWYAGVSVELGNGLIIDERRAELKKAKLFFEASQLERKIIINQLIYDASIAYWNWQNAYLTMKVYDDALKNASIRLEGVKESVLFGERPAIDTLEAKILYQTRKMSFNNSLLKLQNAKEFIELYLWEKGTIPLELVSLAPQKTMNEIDASKTLIDDSLYTNHPFIQLYTNKFNQLSVDLKLKKENLKPKLSLKYNAINEPVGTNIFEDYVISNYTWGASFSYPIISRSERADVRLANLKLEDVQLSQSQKLLEIESKTAIIINKLFMTIEQKDLAVNNAKDYQNLFLAETNLFDLGESSLFMINAREKASLDAQVDLIEVETTLMQIKHELNLQMMFFNE